MPRMILECDMALTKRPVSVESFLISPTDGTRFTVSCVGMKLYPGTFVHAYQTSSLI